jgi:glycosyltransferase involved in cell wall biosynthesis
MVIGIDASQAVREQKTGVQWYGYHLLCALKRLVPPKHRIRLYTPQPLPEALKPLPLNWEERVLTWPFNQGWTLFMLANELRKNPPDVFFSPGHIIPPHIPCKSVVTIHDLGFRDFPRSYAHPHVMNFLHKRDATIATKVIAPSQATKDAIINSYSINPEKIHVIPHGYDADIYHPYPSTDIQQMLDKYDIKKPYVISVGRLEEKKNTFQVLKLVHSVRTQSLNRHAELDSASRINNLQIVLVGTPGHGYNMIKQWIDQNNAGEWVRELGWLPSADTAKLMSGASALVSLSRAEGFGLTILEALACHTPVFASDIPAHREIGKDLVTYTDSDNLADSTNKLLNLINHDASHALSSVEGSLSNYSWSHSAQQTLNLLLSLHS